MHSEAPCDLHGVGGTSIIFTIGCTYKSRITKQGKLMYRTAWRMAETRAANTIRPGKTLQKQHSAASFHPSHKAATQAIYCTHQTPALKPPRLALKKFKKSKRTGTL